jgi:hypothetical protein
MKKCLLFVSVITVLASCKKQAVVTVQPEPLVSKTVEFKIAPLHDYSQSMYNGATAEVKLSVYKQYSNPFSQVVLWDTVITKQALSNYMSMPNPNTITKSFPGLKENEYRIGVSYMVGYVSAPPQSANTWSGMGELIPIGDKVLHKVQLSL